MLMVRYDNIGDYIAELITSIGIVGGVLLTFGIAHSSDYHNTMLALRHAERTQGVAIARQVASNNIVHIDDLVKLFFSTGELHASKDYLKEVK